MLEISNLSIAGQQINELNDSSLKDIGRILEGIRNSLDSSNDGHAILLGLWKWYKNRQVALIPAHINNLVSFLYRVIQEREKFTA